MLNLDGEDGPGLLDGAWGSDEEEERDEEVRASGRHVRPGRHERISARIREAADDAEGSTGLADGGEMPLDAAQTTLFRATAARANYLALDRPDLSFCAKELCRRMSAPRQMDLLNLRRLCRYLLGSPRLVYQYPWQTPGQQLRVYSDTDYAGCIWTRRSTSGGCASVGRHLIKHWSVTQKTVTLSSGEAELGGVVKGATEAIGLRSLAHDLGLELRIELYADSAAAIGICRRTGVGRVRHLAVGQLWVQERLRTGEFTLFKVLGAKNAADLMTKHLTGPSIETHISALGLQPETGRASSAPTVTAEVQKWLLPPG